MVRNFFISGGCLDLFFLKGLMECLKVKIILKGFEGLGVFSVKLFRGLFLSYLR